MAPDDLDMHVIYDVSHNIAKVEEHIVDGKQKTLLVHRKVGSILSSLAFLNTFFGYRDLPERFHHTTLLFQSTTS